MSSKAKKERFLKFMIDKDTPSYRPILDLALLL